MGQTYRKPTAVVVGASLPGCVAAADIGFSGFHVTLLEKSEQLGGERCRTGSAPLPRRFRLRAPYLHRGKTPTTAQELRSYLDAILNAGNVNIQLGHQASTAHFNSETGQWEVTAVCPAAPEEKPSVTSADVLVRACGSGAGLQLTGMKNRQVTEDNPAHLGVEIVGAPNLLAVDLPQPPASKRWPLGVTEALADHCRRYIRQLEIRGPGALNVRADLWFAPASTSSGRIKELRNFQADSHTFSACG